LAMNLIGYAMFCATELLNGKNEFRMPSHRLPSYFGLRLLEQFFATGAAVAFVVTATFLFPGEETSSIIGAGVTCLLFLAFDSTNKFKRARGSQWRQEAPENRQLRISPRCGPQVRLARGS
jgi:hypothetical protein